MDSQQSNDDQPIKLINPFQKLTEEEYRELFKHVEDQEENE